MSILSTKMEVVKEDYEYLCNFLNECGKIRGSVPPKDRYNNNMSLITIVLLKDKLEKCVQTYGFLQQLEELIKKCESKKTKLILDFASKKSDGTFELNENNEWFIPEDKKEQYNVELKKLDDDILNSLCLLYKLEYVCESHITELLKQNVESYHILCADCSDKMIEIFSRYGS